MDVREKLVELANDVLRYLPWGEIQKDTAEQIADRMMDHGVTVQEWISVKDRLPEQYESVIVWTSDRELGEAQFDGERFEWCADEAFADVTHWMPLPQPPKGE